jgi:hypothetical protein
MEWDLHSEDFEDNERKAHENEHLTINVERDIFMARSLNDPEVQDCITPANLLSDDELLPRVIKSISVSTQNVHS